MAKLLALLSLNLPNIGTWLQPDNTLPEAIRQFFAHFVSLQDGLTDGVAGRPRAVRPARLRWARILRAEQLSAATRKTDLWPDDLIDPLRS